MFQAERLDHIAITVQNLERSISWYETILCMEQRFHYRDTTGKGRPTGMCSGQACIVLFPAPEEQAVAPLQGHIALKLDRKNFEQAQEHLRRQGTAFDFVEYKICHSLYFLDPDGYQIELSTYEI
jgi:catechol 2,3-dioxygenase-like lactoylglutathione lyase family enzyme